MSHGHWMYDTDKHFIIDPKTRAVATSDGSKPVLMQYDHNSEHITFEGARFVEGHDLSLCDKVEIHYNNIENGKGKTNKGVYPVEDFRVHPSDNSKVQFTWIVSENSTSYAGTLAFVISFSCTNEGDLLYRWNTDINSSIAISSGIYNGEYVAEYYADVLESWKQDLFGIGDTEEARLRAMADEERESLQYAIDEVKAAALEVQNEVHLKGQQTLATIPESYTELQSTVDALIEDRYIRSTTMVDNVITETFDDGRYRVTTINEQTITEEWYTAEGTLTKTKTIVISQNGVTETITTA